MANTARWGIILGRLGIFFLWEVSCIVFKVKQYILPRPTVILLALRENFFRLTGHTGVTLAVALSGLALAIPIAILLAFALDRSSRLKDFLYPILVVSQTIPIIFIYPLLLIWLGFGISSKILVVFLVCFFPITVNLFKGFSHTSGEQLKLFYSMEAHEKQIYRWLKWPSALPDFFSGLKIAVTYSVMGAVIGEWLGASKGLGRYMINSYKSKKTPEVFAAILLVVVMTLLLFYILELIENKALPWRQTKEINNEK